MAPPTQSRRSVLRTGGTLAAAVATGALAGCTNSPDGSGGRTTDSPDPLALVPSNAGAVFTADVNAVLADDAVQTVYNAWLRARAHRPNYDGPTTLAGTLEDFHEAEGFDLRDLSTITGFHAYPDQPDGSGTGLTGYVFAGSWDESAALAVVDDESLHYSESTYAGHAIHRPAEEYARSLGVLGDGRYVVGSEAAVRAVVDLVQGNAEPLAGRVAEAYRSTSGPIRFASVSKERWYPKETGGVPDVSALRAVETTAGAIYRDGNARGVRIALHASDAAAGENLAETLRATRSMAVTQASTAGGTPDYVLDLLEDLRIARSGATVTVSVERTVGELERIATKLGEGTASSATTDTGTAEEPVDTPQVSFDWAYDADAGTVTITHVAGDNVAADELYVHGEAFAAAERADMTGGGQWAGETGPDGGVSAGDSVVVGVDPDYAISLIWQGDNVAAILAHNEGPEA